MEKLNELGQTSSTETALFHQMAATKYGYGITDMKTVSILLQEGPMTAGQIAKRLFLTTGAVTNLVDRLEREQLVRRDADPRDRRKVIVSVTDEMRGRGAGVYQSMGEAFTKLLRRYTIEELEFLIDYYEATIRMTQQEIEKLANEPLA